MASLPPPTTAAAPSPSTCPFFGKPLHISTIGTNKQWSRVSCRRKDGDLRTSQDKFDRRDVLIGLGGLYGATTLAADRLATAAPLTAPDLSKCGAADLPAGAEPVNCCPPVTKKIVDFKPPPASNTMRIRPAAHLVDKEYVAKFSKAIKLMKELPDDDPRNFKQQANIHCAYCDGAYDQIGFPDLEIQVHNSWLFFPWHRYYLYFFEKILGKLIDDPNFAMPFWNWDSPAGMRMPAFYADSSSPLYDSLRDAYHQPPTVVDLDFDGTDSNTADKQQISSNLTVMYRQVVSSARTAKLFLGSPYRAGDEPNPGAGSLENIPHGPVHLWCGDRTQPNVENMGNFYSAGRDPIFFAHHSNVDRMWTIWNGLGGKRNNFTDSDWLNTQFLFYDENAQLVRVKVKDCLDYKKFGYAYQDVEIPWLKSRPTPKVSKLSRKTKKASVAMAAETSISTATDFPKTLDKPLRVMVKRPKKSRSKKQKDEEEEILVIEGIELDRDGFVKFDVFINDEDEPVIRPENTEFAGSFVNVPHKHGKDRKRIKTQLVLGISELLEELGADDDDSVLVSLVPRAGCAKVTIGGVKIEFD
ncbi:polyphenol oxidase, chloroplastic-like isoform X1 [Diospyros lotus]|uniref:polyphenol oxidase, chloroplastic-like isoform X1 n=1 Tax=Diospyros lotus TaxID=55363 RepID=UPI00225B9501|nr:polyphenol oxidase, chloroplastic-like isoform X1 [Diospyros lotus]